MLGSSLIDSSAETLDVRSKEVITDECIAQGRNFLEGPSKRVSSEFVANDVASHASVYIQDNQVRQVCGISSKSPL